jgi:hypothetical protein
LTLAGGNEGKGVRRRGKERSRNEKKVTGRCQCSKYILVSRNFTLGNNAISENGT